MWYTYPYEDHGDPSVDERWRKTLNRQASQAGKPLVTPIDGFLAAQTRRLDTVEALIADIDQHGV